MLGENLNVKQLGQNLLHDLVGPEEFLSSTCPDYALKFVKINQDKTTSPPYGDWSTGNFLMMYKLLRKKVRC